MCKITSPYPETPIIAFSHYDPPTPPPHICNNTDDNQVEVIYCLTYFLVADTKEHLQMPLLVLFKCVQQGESFSGIPKFHNQAIVKWVSITKKFFWLSEKSDFTCTVLYCTVQQLTTMLRILSLGNPLTLNFKKQCVIMHNFFLFQLIVP